jgi:photosystem II stability/assembly factor-like uncharacterized protein
MRPPIALALADAVLRSRTFAGPAALPTAVPFVAGLAVAVSAALTAIGPAPAAAQAPDTAKLSALEARSIGPAPMSGRIGAIQGVPGRPGHVYVGSATGGVWKTTDDGTTWTPVFDDEVASSVGAIAVHPANPDLVWVGTGEANLRNSTGVGRGVWKSVDGGESWERVGLERSQNVHRIAVHPTDPDVAYVAAVGPLWSAGGQRGLYRTTDGGETWERVLAGPNEHTGAVEVSIDPENPRKLFASLWEVRRWPHFFESGGPGSGLYVSHDGGDSWGRITAEDGLPEGPLGRIGLDVAPSDPSVVYALVEARNTVLLRSDDGGDSFRAVNREDYIGDRPFYYNYIMVDPSSADRIYHVAGTLRLSTDGGRTFEGVATWGGGVHVDHHALWIDPEDPDRVYDGNDGGVYISRDGAGSWRFVTNLPLSQFYEIDVDERVPYNVYGGLQDNGSWKGPSAVWEQGGIRDYHWSEIGFGDGFHALDDPEDPRYAFAESQRGFIVRVDLVTGERKSIRPVAPSDTVDLRFHWNAPIALGPHREDVVYFGSQYLHRSEDDGLSWEVVSPDLTTDRVAWQNQEESGGLTLDVTGAENHTTLYTIAPSPVERGVIWTGSDDGRVHVTRDDAATWTDLTDRIPGAVPEHAWVSHVEASPHAAGTAFVAFHDYMRGDRGTYVYRVDGYGEDWTRIAGDEVDGFARVVIQDPEAPDLLYLGTEFGLWISLDGGGSWTRWTHGLPMAVPVRDLEIQGPERDLVVGTHGRGAYVLDDVRALRELSRDPGLLAGLHLFEPPTAWQHEIAAPKLYRFDGDAMFRGENEPYGALLTFAAAVPDSLRPETEPDTARAGEVAVDEPGGPPRAEEDGEEGRPRPTPEAVLEILEADSVIRTDTVAVQDGLNRLAWNLRVDGFRESGEAGPEGGPGEVDRTPGPQVVPGTYTVRIAFLGDTTAAPVEVRHDPRDTVPAADRRAKFEALVRAGRHHETAARAVERIREAKLAVDELLAVAERNEVEGLDSLEVAGRRLKETLVAVEETWVGPLEEEQGITREAESVVARLGFAAGALASSFDAPTPTQMTRLERAEERLRRAVERTNEVLAEEAADFRERAREAGLEYLPGREPLGAGP